MGACVNCFCRVMATRVRIISKAQGNTAQALRTRCQYIDAWCERKTGPVAWWITSIRKDSAHLATKHTAAYLLACKQRPGLRLQWSFGSGGERNMLAEQYEVVANTSRCYGAAKMISPPQAESLADFVTSGCLTGTNPVFLWRQTESVCTQRQQIRKCKASVCLCNN